jgi:hypothetical protein
LPASQRQNGLLQNAVLERVVAATLKRRTRRAAMRVPSFSLEERLTAPVVRIPISQKPAN